MIVHKQPQTMESSIETIFFFGASYCFPVAISNLLIDLDLGYDSIVYSKPLRTKRKRKPANQPASQPSDREKGRRYLFEF